MPGMNSRLALRRRNRDTLRVMASLLLVPLAAILISIVNSSSVHAQNGAQVLSEISDFADRICGSVSKSGDATSVRVRGEVKAELEGLAKRLANLGISGSGEVTSNKYEGVVQEQLPMALNDVRQCKLSIFEALKPLIISEAPRRPSLPRVQGWLVTFDAGGAGGGNFAPFPAQTVIVHTPASIDIRPFLPPDLSSRNVSISMVARTEHNVNQPGRWVYFVEIIGAPNSYTQCTTFEVQSDGVPIGGGSLPILQGAILKTDRSMPNSQTAGLHELEVKLSCLFQARQFPVVTITLQAPNGEWRPATAGDFNVLQPVHADRPPGR
jgi:hypothetical protein